MSKQGTIEDVLAGRADWALECRDGFALATELASRDVFVDHTISDPPYDEQTHKGKRSMKDVDAESDIDFAPLPPIESFLPSILTITRRWTMLFCTGTMLGDYKRAAGDTRDNGGWWVREGIWHRKDSAPQLTGDRPAAGCEAIAIMHQKGGKMRWNGGGNQAFWSTTICRDPRRIHPTKKPLDLMLRLIRDFTTEGDIVLDVCSGEGTTGEACVKLGRRFIGCEIDPKYHAAGVARIDRAARGLKQIDLLAV